MGQQRDCTRECNKDASIFSARHDGDYVHGLTLSRSHEGADARPTSPKRKSLSEKGGRAWMHTRRKQCAAETDRNMTLERRGGYHLERRGRLDWKLQGGKKSARAEKIRAEIPTGRATLTRQQANGSKGPIRIATDGHRKRKKSDSV